MHPCSMRCWSRPCSRALLHGRCEEGAPLRRSGAARRWPPVAKRFTGPGKNSGIDHQIAPAPEYIKARQEVELALWAKLRIAPTPEYISTAQEVCSITPAPEYISAAQEVARP